MIRFKDVTKNYTDDNVAVNKLNLDIKDGEFFVFIGPSGCGKTTTLKMINRLIPLTTGTIYIDEKRISDYNIHELRFDIGYVLQQIALFPHMTIAENIAIVPELKKWDKEKIYNRTTELLEMVGLDPASYRDRKPKELSGGEQQRVGVVRALAADPSIILMDEPFSALDPITRQKLQQDISLLQKKIKKTIVFVTHDMQEALALGDRICLMQDGEIVQCDTPSNILKNPKNDFVRHFLDSGNIAKPHLLPENKKAKDIIELLTIEEKNTPNLPVLKSDAAISEMIVALSGNNAVQIQNDDGKTYVVTHQDLTKFLASQLEQVGDAK
ncbi:MULTISPECIES: ABC transporter ATP-binding protein [Listeria]|uniref:ABC transporter ATP-binding protein n=1 Tax=Listeria TaxID=1637 RepID=UPI000B589CF1|nr:MULTISPECIES: ABC transporter ATP-binding protein [Listeria]